ncbi:MAG: hypothetical protein R3F05_00255 [Planctomycetota bacterium]
MMLTIWRHDKRWVLGGVLALSVLYTMAVRWISGDELWVPGGFLDEGPIRRLVMWGAMGLGLYASARDRLLGSEELLLFRPVRSQLVFGARVLACLGVIGGALVAAYTCSWFGLTHWGIDRTTWTLVELAPRLAVNAGALPALALGMWAGRELSFRGDWRRWVAMAVVAWAVFEQAEELLYPEVWHHPTATWPMLLTGYEPWVRAVLPWQHYVASQVVVAAPLFYVALQRAVRPADPDAAGRSTGAPLAKLPYVASALLLAATFGAHAFASALDELFDKYPSVILRAKGPLYLARLKQPEQPVRGEAPSPSTPYWLVYDVNHQVVERIPLSHTKDGFLAGPSTSGTLDWTQLRLLKEGRANVEWAPPPLRGPTYWRPRGWESHRDGDGWKDLALLARLPDGFLELALDDQPHHARWPLRWSDNEPVAATAWLFRVEEGRECTRWALWDPAIGRLETATIRSLIAGSSLEATPAPAGVSGFISRAWMAGGGTGEQRRTAPLARFEDGWRRWSPEGWGPRHDEPEGDALRSCKRAECQVIREGDDLLDHTVVILDREGRRLFKHQYRPRTSEETKTAADTERASLATPLIVGLAARLRLPPRDVLWQPLIASGAHDGLLLGVLGIGLLCAFVAWLRMRRLEMPSSLRRFWIGSVLLGGPAVLLMHLLVVTRRAWRSELTSAPGGALPKLLRVPRTRLGRETS